MGSNALCVAATYIGQKRRVSHLQVKAPRASSDIRSAAPARWATTRSVFSLELVNSVRV